MCAYLHIVHLFAIAGLTVSERVSFKGAMFREHVYVKIIFIVSVLSISLSVILLKRIRNHHEVISNTEPTYFSANKSLENQLKQRETKILIHTGPTDSSTIKSLKNKLKERETTIKEIAEFKQNNPGVKQLPKVIGIGVKKCGTGGVISFLANHHPLIKVPWQVQTETFFFGSSRTKGGPDAYRAFFPPTNSMELGMEKTPIYFVHSDLDIPSAIKNMVPEAKLLLIVCDPTKRSFSDYTHERVRLDLYNDQLIAKYNTFEDYVNEYLPKVRLLLQKSQNNLTSYQDDLKTQNMLIKLRSTDLAATLISTGLYIYHIQRWKKLYNESNLLVIDGENFREDTGAVIENIQDFLGIPKLLWKEDSVKNPDTGFYCFRKFTEKHLNESYVETEDELKTSLKCLGKSKGRTRNGAKHASPETLERLKQFYKPYNEAFYREMGQTYKWL
ncbi:heparan sulfate glucosamine 3-O-sulfotransferase 2-like isoform X1 [Clavelina lepadiformis]|uniref:heparan sulfate glucosamine 3-O-sulfotransferase 2-like isoform X1 n=1 Tax=Clavelina lepadiformis TaxID=159417 RepID=UPI004041841F